MDRSDRGRDASLASLGAIAACAAVTVLLALYPPPPAAATGQPDTIRILPDAAAGGRVWDWSATCPLGPRTGSACLKAGPILGSAQLNADEWNLGATNPGQGDVQTSMSSLGGLTARGQLPVDPPCTASTCIASRANTWVRGYVNVAYGKNPCRTATSPASTKTLSLPVKVRALPADLVGTTTYTAQSASYQSTYDVAYDMWLNPSGTQRPCRTRGTVEVMLWTDYDRQAVDPSTDIGTASIPYAVNGTTHPGTNAWSVSTTNIFRANTTTSYGGTVFLQLSAADIIASGTVSVDVSKALAEVGRILHQDFGWTGFVNRYWLDTVPFGMEFGPPDALPSGDGSTTFMLNLSSFCLAVRASVVEPRC